MTGSTGPHRVPEIAELPRIPGFEIERELGRGGMGVVYRARELNTDRIVALKFLPGGPLAAPHDRQRWLKEARAAARVRHPNIVQLHHTDEAGGWLYLVLEYMPGGSLQERLKGPVAPRLAAMILASIADTSEQMHRAGIWHLDLKPANILIDAAPGTPLDRAPLKVADFGIARSSDGSDTSCSSRGAGQGTPAYMAPEQVNGRRSAIGAATDIHALGAILYELLTGRPPFLADSDAETMQQIQTREPVPPGRLNPKVPRDLEVICLKCLEKVPGRRYASAEAVAADVRRFLDGHPIAARPVSPFEKASRWCRRRPAIASLVFALALTLASGFVGLFALWRISERSRARVLVERAQVELERNRAEAEFEISRGALAEVIKLGAWGIHSPVVISRNELINSLGSARGRIVELAGRRPNDRAVCGLLAEADLYLGRNLDLEAKLAEALPIQLESLSLWEKLLEEYPDDRSAMYNRWRSLMCLAMVLEKQGRLEESRRHWERALCAGEETFPLVPDSNSLMQCRSALARLVDNVGNHQRAQALLEANLRMLIACSEKAPYAEIHQLLSQTRQEIQRLDPSRQRPQIPPPAGPKSIDLLWSLLLSQCDCLTSEERAEILAGQLFSGPAGATANGPNREDKLGMLVESLILWTASKRHTGKLDEARSAADRMLVFGRFLVGQHGGHPRAHLVLSEAYFQMSKNAWPIGDLTAVKQNLKLSIDSAMRALTLDPNNDVTRHVVEDRQRRLDRLVGPS